jgi:hypothetical protein
VRLIIVKIVIVLILPIAFAGCIESPMQQESYVINGKIYGLNYNYDYFLVSAGMHPVTFLDHLDREFRVSAITKPYDLYIYGFHLYEAYPDLTLKFSNLTINDLNIISDDASSAYFNNENGHCIVYIYFPMLTESKVIGFKLVSDDEYLQSSDDIRFVYVGKYNVLYAIFIPEDKSSISGKLYYLEITVDPRNRWNFLSFDKFGMKDVTLANGYNDPIIFTNADISYNPAEYLMPVNINLPSGFRSESNILLSAPSKHKSSDLPLHHLWGALNANKLIPILPGNDFKIKLYTEYRTSQIFDSEGNEFIHVNPGEPANFTHNKTINLLAPSNQGQNVVDSTSFVITDSDGPAVYEYTLCVEPERYLTFYTTEKSIRFSDFRTSFFSPYKNKQYYWQVRKFPKFNSTDEFLSQPYILDNRLNYIELSEVRSFTTAP